jgi:hypothetical protein
VPEEFRLFLGHDSDPALSSPQKRDLVLDDPDYAVCLVANDGVSQGGSGSSFGDKQRSDSVGRENFRGRRAKSLAPKARIASYDHERGIALFKPDLARHPGKRVANISKRNCSAHDCAPTRCFELDFG